MKTRSIIIETRQLILASILGALKANPITGNTFNVRMPISVRGYKKEAIDEMENILAQANFSAYVLGKDYNPKTHAKEILSFTKSEVMEIPLHSTIEILDKVSLNTETFDNVLIRICSPSDIERN